MRNHLTVSPALRLPLLLALGVLLLAALLPPFLRWQRSLEEEIARRQQVAAREQALAGSQARLEAELQKASAAYTAAARYFYRDFADARALQLKLQKKVEQLAAASRIKLKSCDWLLPVTGFPLQVPLKLRFEARPGELVSFLHALENDSYFYTIDHLMVGCDLSAYGIGPAAGGKHE